MEAVLGEADRDGTPDARTGAGHDGDAPGGHALRRGNGTTCGCATVLGIRPPFASTPTFPGGTPDVPRVRVIL